MLVGTLTPTMGFLALTCSVLPGVSPQPLRLLPRPVSPLQKLPPCETKPVSLQEIMAIQQNGCVKSVAEASELTLGPSCPHHVPIQVEQEAEQEAEPAAAGLDHCTIEISELETNV